MLWYLFVWKSRRSYVSLRRTKEYVFQNRFAKKDRFIWNIHSRTDFLFVHLNDIYIVDFSQRPSNHRQRCHKQFEPITKNNTQTILNNHRNATSIGFNRNHSGQYTKHIWTRMKIPKPFSWLCLSIESMSTWLALDECYWVELWSGISLKFDRRKIIVQVQMVQTGSIFYFRIILNPKIKREKQTAFENILRSSGNCEKLIRWLLVFHWITYFSFYICIWVWVQCWSLSLLLSICSCRNSIKTTTNVR